MRLHRRDGLPPDLTEAICARTLTYNVSSGSRRGVPGIDERASEYERNDSLGNKEMMEARVDAVFASIAGDPAFVSLTAGADGKLPMPRQ